MRCALAIAALGLAACARSVDPPPALRVVSAEARVLPNGAGVVFARIENDGDGPDRLTRVEAGTESELHETVSDGDIVEMRPAPAGFRIPAHGGLVLEHGGKHAMLAGADPAATSLHVVFDFDRSGAVPADVAVEKAAR
jgi:copper(I)-binding protein